MAYEYDEKKWKSIPSGYPKAPFRFGHTSVCIENSAIGPWDWLDDQLSGGNLLLTYGGCDEDGMYTNDLWVCETNGMKWKNEYYGKNEPQQKKSTDNSVPLYVEPPKKDGHSMVAYKNESLFVFGGTLLVLYI